MSEEVTKEVNTDVAGVPKGVTANDLSAGQTGDIGDAGIPVAPVVQDRAAPKEVDAKDEEFVDPNAKEEPKEPEDKADEEEPKDKDADDALPTEHEDPVVQAALNLINEAGVSLTEADEWYKEVNETDDITKLDKVAIYEKLGKDKGELVISAITANFEKNQARVGAIKEAVFESTGGEENFNTIKDWAITKQDNPEFSAEMSQYIQMLELGPVAAKLAGEAMTKMYNADPKNKSLNINMVDGDRQADLTPEVTLTRDEYLTQVQAAYDKGDTREVARLKAIRGRSHKR